MNKTHSAKSSGVGIKFTPEQLSEINRMAGEKSVSRAEIVRAAVSIGLPLLKMGVAINSRRVLQIFEYTQLALSMKVEREYPADAHQLLTMAMRNVDEYHG